MDWRQLHVPLSEFPFELQQTGFIQRVNDLLNGSCILLEVLSEDLLVPFWDLFLSDDGFFQGLTDNQGRASLVGVYGQIVCSTVGAPHTLCPTRRVLDLGIPAVAGVMRHLVAHVLSETQASSVDTNLDQEEVDAPDKVAQRLVVNDAGRDGLANRLDRNIRLS